MEDKPEIDRKQIWQDIIAFIETRFGKRPDLDALLFIIGMRELGHLKESNFKKDDKVSLMHIATCKILSYSDHYELVGTDDDGWPHWKLKIHCQIWHFWNKKLIFANTSLNILSTNRFYEILIKLHRYYRP